VWGSAHPSISRYHGLEIMTVNRNATPEQVERVGGSRRYGQLSGASSQRARRQFRRPPRGQTGACGSTAVGWSTADGVDLGRRTATVGRHSPHRPPTPPSTPASRRWRRQMHAPGSRSPVTVRHPGTPTSPVFFQDVFVCRTTTSDGAAQHGLYGGAVDSRNSGSPSAGARAASSPAWTSSTCSRHVTGSRRPRQGGAV